MPVPARLSQNQTLKESFYAPHALSLSCICAPLSLELKPLTCWATRSSSIGRDVKGIWTSWPPKSGPGTAKRTPSPSLAWPKTLRLGKERVEHEEAAHIFGVDYRDAGGRRRRRARCHGTLGRASGGGCATGHVVAQAGADGSRPQSWRPGAGAGAVRRGNLRYADPILYLQPARNGHDRQHRHASTVAGATMSQMRELPYRLLFPQPGRARPAA